MTTATTKGTTMSTPTRTHSSGSSGNGSRRLPAYQSLFAVDVRDFSGYQGRDHAELTSRIPRILAAAFDRCGLREVWSEEIWHRMIGDSYVAGFRSSMLPLLLNPLLGALQAQLEHVNRTESIGDPPRPIRMRASIHVGPATEPAGDGDADGSGDARVEIHRLLDADVVKNLLSRSGDETCVAAIVSERAFSDAVVSGYAGERPSEYVRAQVTVKSYEATALLRVPHPSGELLTRGFLSPQVDSGDADQPTQLPDGADGNQIGSVARDAVQAGTYQDHRVIGVGSARDVGNVITENRGPVHVRDGNEAAGKRAVQKRRPRRDK